LFYGATGERFQRSALDRELCLDAA
jgi:hypothetical protein